MVAAFFSHQGQLSILPSVRREVSTDQSAVMFCGQGLKIGVAYSICGLMYVWQVKLCELSLQCSIPDRLGDQSVIKRYTKTKCPVYFTQFNEIFASLVIKDRVQECYDSHSPFPCFILIPTFLLTDNEDITKFYSSRLHTQLLKVLVHHFSLFAAKVNRRHINVICPLIYF